MKFFELGLREPGLRAELDAAYARVMASEWMILGQELEAFEAEFAGHCGAEHAIGVGNGFDALVLAMRAAGIAPGTEVIVPSHTFAATWLAVTAVGARPVPVDVDPATYVMTPGAASEAVGSRTSAILPVSLYGHPVDVEGFLDLAGRHGLFLLEDAAQSHGAELHGRRTGSGAHATAFSFYPTKNLGALGDGGAVTTNDAGLADRLRRLRNYGSSQKYVHEESGLNSRLDELQAAFLRVFLARLDRRNAARRSLAARYEKELAGKALSLPTAAAGARHAFHLYVVRSPERDIVKRRLAEAGIETQIHYPVPCHLQPAFADLDLPRGQFPLAERLSEEVLSLPLWPDMPEDRIIEVARALS